MKKPQASVTTSARSDVPRVSESSWDGAAEAKSIIAKLATLPGALLPILHALQDRFGYIHPEAQPLIAEALNISRAEVRGVVSFYHDFRTAPPGRHIVRLCRAEACQSMGGRALEAHLRQRLGLQTAGAGGASTAMTTADQAFTLEPVYCLGNCACAPSVMVDGVLHGRLSAPVLDSLLERARRQA